MKKLLSYKRIYILVLLPISLFLIVLAKSSSYFTEQIYARHIYKWISQIISSITGLLPFSIAELILVALPVILLVVVLNFTIKLIAEKENRGERMWKGLLNVLCSISILLFLFTLMGGLNYYRYSFTKYSDLEISESTLEELYAITSYLAVDANGFRAQVPMTDDRDVFQLSMSMMEMAKVTDDAYKLLGDEYPILKGSYGAPKPILLSKYMSYTEITGLFFPFTMEANVNVDVSDYTIPATMLHELAHLRGFMREDEANYLAYLAGMKSDNVEVNYSSTMLALITAGNALYDQDTNLYFEIRDQFSEDVMNDIRANSLYWTQYDETVISAVSNNINDTYLKVNAQEDGVKSYGRMLDLLIAKYKKDILK